MYFFNNLFYFETTVLLKIKIYSLTFLLYVTDKILTVSGAGGF